MDFIYGIHISDYLKKSNLKGSLNYCRGPQVSILKFLEYLLFIDNLGRGKCLQTIYGLLLYLSLKKQKVPSNCADMFLLTQRVHTPTKAHTDVYKVGMLSQD